MARILNIAHRGAMAGAPENTMEAFELAVKQGADMFELDAKLTLDGEVVVFHDNKVNRMTDGSGRIGQMDWEDIEKLKVKGGGKVPRLDEVLDRFGGRIYINIELKAKGTGQPACRLVKERGLIDRVIFSSFDGMELARVRNEDENARLAFLCEDKKLKMVSIARRLDAEAVGPKHRLCKPALVKEAHSAGLKVYVWTVNSRGKMKKFARMGVDGIITNKPGLLKEVLAEF